MDLEEWVALVGPALGIELWRIPVVMLSAIGIYLAFLLLVRLFTPRVLARLTVFDAVVLVMFGAVAGRVVIGHPPTLAAGVVGLATLMAMEAFFGAVRSTTGLRALLQGGPVVVVAHGEVVEKALRRTHLSRLDINAVLRRAGIGSLGEVQALIAEPSGELSLFRRGQPIDAELLEGVRGAELLR
ncbi:DUF421 domain-containing protein [Corynebacterium halotolerans]|uniref:YetF C-terminal domain-containing protein n=1 Tax=Corynebacterium halotolerans YIM 70093 = DSM 44683 TaxID=1121362 RepID=M1NUM5_9CORY|nr:YetF domain-containing protein [Corynebacterium halotolerans]AGF71215.1 hypothetical protein A605_00995 [Corynebacterium halotolerans YIM 70093 = DSM 44683]